jgi:RNA polymerase sigma-70 factor, ECF subfamily
VGPNVGGAEPGMEELRQVAYRLAVRIVSREDAEDVAQEAVLRVLKATRNGTAVRVRRAFVSRVALHLALDHMRAGRTRQEGTRSAGEMRPAAATSSPADDVERLYEAIAALPRRQAAVVTLRKLMEMEYEEVAELLGISVENCRSHCRLGLRRLRAELMGREAGPSAGGKS